MPVTSTSIFRTYSRIVATTFVPDVAMAAPPCVVMRSSRATMSHRRWDPLPPHRFGEYSLLHRGWWSGWRGYERTDEVGWRVVTAARGGGDGEVGVRTATKGKRKVGGGLLRARLHSASNAVCVQGIQEQLGALGSSEQEWRFNTTSSSQIASARVFGHSCEDSYVRWDSVRLQWECCN